MSNVITKTNRYKLFFEEIFFVMQIIHRLYGQHHYGQDVLSNVQPHQVGILISFCRVFFDEDYFQAKNGLPDHFHSTSGDYLRFDPGHFELSMTEDCNRCYLMNVQATVRVIQDHHLEYNFKIYIISWQLFVGRV